MMNDSGEKPFVCVECETISNCIVHACEKRMRPDNYKSKFIRHILMHTGENQLHVKFMTRKLLVLSAERWSKTKRIWKVTCESTSERNHSSVIFVRRKARLIKVYTYYNLALVKSCFFVQYVIKRSLRRTFWLCKLALVACALVNSGWWESIRWKQMLKIIGKVCKTHETPFKLCWKFNGTIIWSGLNRVVALSMRCLAS